MLSDEKHTRASNKIIDEVGDERDEDKGRAPPSVASGMKNGSRDCALAEVRERPATSAGPPTSPGTKRFSDFQWRPSWQRAKNRPFVASS